MNLANVTIGGDPKPPRIVLCGLDGVGKSTFASQAPNPIFIPTERGVTALQVPQFPVAQNPQDVTNCIGSLYHEEHDYKTVILDSADWYQDMLIQQITDDIFEGHSHKFANYGAGYKPLKAQYKQMLAHMDSLNTDKGMHVVIITHAMIKTFKNPNGEDYDRYQSNLVDSPSSSLWSVTKEWADLVLFASFNVLVSKPSKSATKGKAVMAEKRVLTSPPAAAIDAKQRAGWEMEPRTTALTWQAFASALDKAKASRAV